MVRTYFESQQKTSYLIGSPHRIRSARRPRESTLPPLQQQPRPVLTHLLDSPVSPLSCETMCGIAGYIQRASSPARPIEAMTARLAHRGPDGFGRLGIAHRRRLDDSHWAIAGSPFLTRAHGPTTLATDDGSAHITYNGEVLQLFPSCARRWSVTAIQFHTHCDTEGSSSITSTAPARAD
jgi:hypothetical protein